MRMSWIGLTVAVATAASCGGGAGELRLNSRTERQAEAVADTASDTASDAVAVSDNVAVSDTVADTASDSDTASDTVAVSDLPVPGDAAAEAHADASGAERAFGARYPLHGVAFHVLSHVFDRPGGDVKGYMRRGARFRAAAGERGAGCDSTWHELSSGGYVCRGRGFALGQTPQSFEPAPAPPVRHDALPYPYAKNVGHDVPQFWRVPTEAEAEAARELVVLAREEAAARIEAASGPDAEANEPAASPEGAGEAVTDAAAGLAASEPRDPDSIGEDDGLPDYVRMGMQPGFYVSLDAAQSALDADERHYLRTVRGAYVPEDKLLTVAAPPAPGVPLDGRDDLPLAIAHRGEARRVLRSADGGALRIVDPLPPFAHAKLTGDAIVEGPKRYLLARDGHFISEKNLRIVRPVPRPALVPRHARWIHVNLAEQTLTAYEGDRPVFATLVSSGKEGYETPAGLFRIHTKHVTTTMDGMAGTDDVYSIEDVPWTMYFHGSYALHAAFWHDRFGRVRSHGCVNLAPEDARWLFRWTTPDVPAHWHGARALSAADGTFVFVDPGTDVDGEEAG
jgi:hypothetical protein